MRMILCRSHESLHSACLAICPSARLSVCNNFLWRWRFFLDRTGSVLAVLTVLHANPNHRPSVRPSVGRSVTPVQKPRFLAVFGDGEILH